MDIIKKIKMGSSVFFDGLKGFSPKDTDWLCLADNPFCKDKAMRVNIKGDDIVIYPSDFTKEKFIEELLECKLGLKVGKFLVPEFIEYFGVTIDDLKQFKTIVNTLDDEHKYEKVIYNAYIKNGKFELTDAQRKNAFKAYKEARKIKEEEKTL